MTIPPSHAALVTVRRVQLLSLLQLRGVSEGMSDEKALEAARQMIDSMIVRPPPDTRDGEIAELNAYRSAFGGGEFNGEPIILSAETIRQRGNQYNDLMHFFNKVVEAVEPPDDIMPGQLTPWIYDTISALRSAVEKARPALEQAKPFVEMIYQETDREEAADAKFVMNQIDEALAALNAVTPSKGEG